MTDQIQKDDLSHQQVLAAILKQTRVDKYPSMTNEGFRDDINSLKEFEEGKDFVRELKEDLSTWPLPETVQEPGEAPEKETHKTYRCRCWTEEGEKCTKLFETHRARVAHEVRVLRLGGMHGLKLYVTTMTMSNVSDRARYWSTTWPPPGTVQEPGEAPERERETHKTHRCRTMSNVCPMWETCFRSW